MIRAPTTGGSLASRNHAELLEGGDGSDPTGVAYKSEPMSMADYLKDAAIIVAAGAVVMGGAVAAGALVGGAAAAGAGGAVAGTAGAEAAGAGAVAAGTAGAGAAAATPVVAGATVVGSGAAGAATAGAAVAGSAGLGAAATTALTSIGVSAATAVIKHEVGQLLGSPANPTATVPTSTPIYPGAEATLPPDYYGQSWFDQFTRFMFP